MEIDIERYWVIDVEGSGGYPPEIVELAMLQIDRLVLTENKRHWFVRPEHGIQPAATRIHGLTDDDVVGSPEIADIADDIVTWIEDTPIVGHNVKIEVEILSRSIPDWKPKSAIDTLKLTKILKPGLASYGLPNLGVEFGLADEAANRTGAKHHSALYDATLTALLMIHLLSPLTIDERRRVLTEANILNPRQGSLL
jgi:DNA polymerase III epsilon subunit-like protein